MHPPWADDEDENGVFDSIAGFMQFTLCCRQYLQAFTLAGAVFIAVLLVAESIIF